MPFTYTDAEHPVFEGGPDKGYALKWLQALKSGNYKSGGHPHILRKDKTHSALGVLVDVLAKEGLVHWYKNYFLGYCILCNGGEPGSPLTREALNDVVSELANMDRKTQEKVHKLEYQSIAYDKVISWLDSVCFNNIAPDGA